MSIAPLLLFLFLSIFFSFLCSILEAVLLSVNETYIRQEVRQKTRTGELLTEYKSDIDKPLSAILILNTVAHTVGAIGVGVQAGKIFGDDILHFLGISISYESIIASLMTLAILVLSEIIPKTIGANNWKSLAPISVRVLKVFMIALAPLIWCSKLLTSFLKKEKEKSVLSRYDFTLMAEIGEETGALQKQESTIIRNLVNLETLTVRDIMTPKTVALFADGKTTLTEFYKKEHPFIFSRVPIYDETIDNIVGIFLKDEFLSELVEGNGDKTLLDIHRSVNVIEDTTTLETLFRQLSTERTHLNVVVDGYGSVVGIVTLEDLFETLLGAEILDEIDTVADLQAYAKEKARQRREKLIKQKTEKSEVKND